MDKRSCSRGKITLSRGPNSAMPRRWDTSRPVQLAAAGKAAGLAALALFVVGFATWNLAAYPTISGWDEGIYLQFAQNILRYGEYATRNGGKFERLVPNGGSGPLHIGAVALGMAAGGDSLLAARVGMALFLIASASSCFLLLRRMGGLLAAAAGTLGYLVAGSQAYDTLWLGRQVLAEIPSLCFLLLGWHAWQRSWDRGALEAGLAGLCMSLAVLAKNQLVVVLVPALVMLAVADRLYYRQLRWWHTALPLIGAGLGYIGWICISLWIVGPGQRPAYLDALAALTATQFQLGPQRWRANLGLLYHSGQWPLALAALVANLWQIRGRDRRSLARCSLVLLAGLAFLAFIAISPPWPRYLHLPLALAMLCAGLCVEDAARRLVARWPAQRVPVAATLALALALLLGPRYIANTQRLVLPADESARQFARLLDAEVPPGEPIHNWEWEVEFYSLRDFTHPDFRLFAALVGAHYNDQYDPRLDGARIPTDATYVIVGPFSRGTGVFAQELAARSARRIAEVGPYELYQLAPALRLEGAGHAPAGTRVALHRVGGCDERTNA